MTDTTSQSYKDLRWSYLLKVENYIPSFYLDTKGVLTIGTGLNVINQNGVPTNRAIFVAASQNNSVANMVMDRFAEVAADFKGQTQFKKKPDFDRSDFKEELDAAGILTSFELTTGTNKAWIVNIVGLKVLDSNGNQEFDDEGNPLVIGTRNVFPLSQARTASELWIATNDVEAKIDRAFGTIAPNLTSEQRIALTSMLYQRGASPSFLTPVAAAVAGGDANGLFLALAAGRTSEPNRVLSDYSQFSGAQKVSVDISATETRTGVYIGTGTGDYVIAYSDVEKKFIRFEGRADSAGNYQVTRQKLEAGKWISLADTIDDPAKKLASLGAMAVNTAEGPLEPGQLPPWAASLIAETDAEGRRSLAWTQILERDYGPGIGLQTKTDGQRVLVDAAGHEVATVELNGRVVTVVSGDRRIELNHPTDSETGVVDYGRATVVTKIDGVTQYSDSWGHDEVGNPIYEHRSSTGAVLERETTFATSLGQIVLKEDSDGSTISRTTTQFDENGNRLIVTDHADGSSTVVAIDSTSTVIGNGAFHRDSGIDDTSGAFEMVLSGRPIVFDAEYVDGTLTLVGFRSINGTEVEAGSLMSASLADADINAKDVLFARNGIGTISQLANTEDPSISGGWVPSNPSPETPWYGTAIAQQLGGSLTSIQSLLAGIQSGKPLAIGSAIFSLAAHLSRHVVLDGNNNPVLDQNGNVTFNGGDEALNAISVGFSTINSLSSLKSALDRGDPLGALSSGLSLTNAVLTTYQSVLASQISTQFGSIAAARIAIDQSDEIATQLVQQYDAVGSAIGQVGAVLPWISLFIGLKNGDALSVIGAVAALLNYPVVGWIIAVYQILDFMFHDYDIEGIAEFQSAGNGRNVIAALTSDSDGGGDIVMSVVSNLLDRMDQLLEDLPNHGFIASRLPKIAYVGHDDGSSGEYTMTWTDPATGKEVVRIFDSATRLEAVGSGDSVAPGDEGVASHGGELAYSQAFHWNLADAFFAAVQESGAIAPFWEVQTIDQQLLPRTGPVGPGSDLPVLLPPDPLAGLSTIERARANGQLLATDPGDATARPDGAQQDFRPIVLTLNTDGDGHGTATVTRADEGGGVLFDVDDDGYAEASDWIGPLEGILVLDRNGDGRISSGHEMFSDSQVDMAARGLHVLDEIDANGDGVINDTDPAFEFLRVWQDINHDGVVQTDLGPNHVTELSSMAEWKVRSLNIDDGTYTVGGVSPLRASNGEGALDAASEQFGYMVMPSLQANAAGIMTKSEGNSLYVVGETGNDQLFASALADYGKSTTPFGHSHSSSDGQLTATDELADGLEDVAIVVSAEQLLANDLGASTSLVVSSVGSAQSGTVSMDTSNGTIRFTPSANFAGMASFTYTVTDESGRQAAATAFIDVVAVNDVPEAVAQGSVHRALASELKIVNIPPSGESEGITLYTLPTGARAIRTEAVPVGEISQLGSTRLGTELGVVGFRGGQLVWGPYEHGVQGDNDIFLPPTEWFPVEVVGMSQGQLLATDVETPDGLTYKLKVDARFGDLSLNELTGAWTYVQTDPYEQDDSFIVEVADAQGTSSLITVVVDNEQLQPPIFQDGGGEGAASGESGDPVVLDLNGDGFWLSSVANSSAFFDFDDDGQRELTGWTSPADGLLAFDANGNGRIDASNELSFTSYVAGATTDLQGLAAFDTNHDGKLSAADAQWSKFRIWRDLDSDGFEDLGELLTPVQVGIAAIGLASDNTGRTVQGNTIHGTGSFTRIDGSTGQLADVTFATGTEVWREDAADEVTASAAGGPISTGTGDDRIHGGAGADVVDAGAGDDRIAGAGGDDVIRGASGNDMIAAEAGADLAEGGVGDDAISGGDGADQLHGGAGSDVLIGDADDDQLFGDDGNDQLFSGEGSDSLAGGAGRDGLVGGEGNDRLDGGTGSDDLQGESGNDVYFVDHSLDLVIEADGGGADTVVSSVDVAGMANVEVIALAGSEDLRVTGSADADIIFGNAGDNILDGSAGADRMLGGAGDDTYVVDNANDVVVEAADSSAAAPAGASLLNADNSLATGAFNTYGHTAGNPTAGGTDAVKASVSWHLGANVENLTLTGIAAIDGTGNDAANVITGNTTANTITGGRGNDTLKGSGGADTYVFARGDGSDRIEDLAGGGVIQFGQGIAWSDLRLREVGSDLVIDLLLNGQSGSDRITLAGWVGGNGRVDSVQFADGSTHALTIAQNQAPVAVADTAQIQQQASSAISGNVLSNDHDPDAADTLRVSNPATLHGSYGTLVLASNGSYTYTLDSGSSSLSSLAQGQTASDTFSYIVSDGNATAPLTATSTLTVQITGDNDAPVLSASLPDVAAKVLRTLDIILPSATFSDVDQGDALTWSAQLASGDALPDWLSFDPSTHRLTGMPPRSLSGQSFDIRITSTDQAGASADDVFRLNLDSTGATLTGTMGADSLTGTDLDDTLSGLAGNDSLAGGAGFDTYAFGRGDGVDQVLDAEQGGRVLLGSGLTSTDLKLIRVGNDGVIELLNAAQSGTEQLVLTDWFAAAAAADRVSRIDFANGQSLALADTSFNQAPVISDDAAEGTEDSLAISGNVLSNDHDPDALDVLKVTNAGIYTTAWGKLDLAEGGTWVYTPSDDAQTLAAGQTIVEHFNVAISDRSGAEGLTGTSVLTVTLTGSNDVPTVTGSVGDLSTSIRLPFTLQLPSALFADVDADDLLTWSVTLTGGQALPSWITYDAGTRTLTGTPPDAASGAALQLEVTATDGSGARATAMFQLDVTSNGLVLTGTEGADTLVGSELNDTITGLGGSDVLDGAGGADKLAGGTGDDRYVVDDPLDVVTEEADAGYDTVVASIAALLGNNVENLMLIGPDAIDGTGNELDNALVGNAAINRLLGMNGNDVLAGGQGDDVLDGGAGDDLYLYNQGEGSDLISDASGADTLRFGPGMTLDSVVARQVTVDGQAKVFISILGVDGAEQADQGIEMAATGGIERFEFADGSVRTLADLMNSSRTLNGGNGNDTLTGDRRDDTINGSNGNDLLYGRTGNDILDGSNGTDKLFGEGGNDTLRGGNEPDELWGGAGDDALDGSNGADLLVAGSGNDLLTGGNDPDRLDGGDGNDVLDGFNGLDDLYAGAGDDSLDGGNDNDVLAAGPGNDTITTGNGRDAVVAGAGNDSVDTSNDNDFVDAAAGADVITTGNGADFIAAGQGNDTIDAGQDQDFLAFNRGDGADVVLTSSWQRDTLSLGGGIRYADLKLSKSGNDLVLTLGAGDSVTFKDWYKDSTRRNLTTLQLVTAATGGDYDATSSDRLLNQKVVGFNFETLVNKFDQWRVANPNQSEWSLASELNTFYVSGSNATAMGGDLAWRYATTGSYGDIDARGAVDKMSSMSATSWQSFTVSGTLDPWTALQAGILLLSDPTTGLPSPITPMNSPSSNELFFAAINGTGHKPDWVGTTPGAVIP